MKKLIIKKLTILSKNKDEGNEFTFSNDVNFILSDNNSAGKTTILNLIYSALGCNVKFQDEWIPSFIRLDILVDNKSYSLYKTPNNTYYIQYDNKTTLYTNDSNYHNALHHILGYKIYLKDHNGNLKITRPAHFFLTSYIPQSGWNSFFTGSFKNLGEFKKYKSDLITQFCKVKSEEELENENELQNIKASIDKKNNEQNVLLSTIEQLELNTIENLDKFKKRVQLYENKLNKLQENLSNLVVEKQFLINEITYSISTISELNEDYKVARNNPSEIECPYCGTLHSNSITEKSELFFLKTKLEEDTDMKKEHVKKITSKILDIEKKIAEITEHKNNTSSLISDNTKGIMKAITINGISNVLINLKSDISTLNIQKKDIEKTKRTSKEYKQHKESVHNFFESKLNYYANKLSIIFSSKNKIKKVTDYNKVINNNEGGAADHNRSILAYYLAIYATAISYNTEIIPPLVINSPNQNEQDENNYDAIVNTLINEKEKQIIVCSINNEKLKSIQNINKIYVNKIMKKGNFLDLFLSIMN